MKNLNLVNADLQLQDVVDMNWLLLSIQNDKINEILIFSMDENDSCISISQNSKFQFMLSINGKVEFCKKLPKEKISKSIEILNLDSCQFIF
jgi:hypothetical protein